MTCGSGKWDVSHRYGTYVAAALKRSLHGTEGAIDQGEGRSVFRRLGFL